jgi:hypothetical protein
MTGRVLRHVSLRQDLGGESCRCLGEGGDESRRLLGPNDPSQADRVSTRAAGQVSGRRTQRGGTQFNSLAGGRLGAAALSLRARGGYFRQHLVPRSAALRHWRDAA